MAKKRRAASKPRQVEWIDPEIEHDWEMFTEVGQITMEEQLERWRRSMLQQMSDEVQRRVERDAEEG